MMPPDFTMLMADWLIFFAAKMLMPGLNATIFCAAVNTFLISRHRLISSIGVTSLGDLPEGSRRPFSLISFLKCRFTRRFSLIRLPTLMIDFAEAAGD